MSNYQLSTDQVTVLTKGLNFIPTPNKDNPTKILQDILLFDSKIRLKYHFHHNPDHSNCNTSQDSNPIEQPTNTILCPSSGWTPPSGQKPFLDTYRNSIIKEFLKDLDQPKLSRKKNLTNKEYQAMRYLHNNPNIIIKQTDKGGSIAIMNTVDYVKEAQRQLFNQQHYKTLDRDPTNPYNRYVHHHIDQAWRMGIIDENTQENLQAMNPKIASFYLLPKIHKPNNPGRPIGNSIGSVTEMISAFVDEHLRKFTPRIPSHVKNTTHFINITKNIQLDPDDLLVTTELCTSTYHTQRVLEALNNYHPQ